MSNTFKASNGVRVTISQNTGCVVATDDSVPNTVIASDAHLNALREYFAQFPTYQPWMDAEPGEIWDVDLLYGGIRAVTVNGEDHDEPTVVFRDIYDGVEYDLTDAAIRDARLVWGGVRHAVQ